MGSSRRHQPAQLSLKLVQIRCSLKLSQEEMAKQLSTNEVDVRPGHVSEFEHGKREPALIVLLKYSELAGVSINMLVDDKQCLPTRMLKKLIGG